MSDPEQQEDFAAMFEASLKAKRLEKGDLVEGTIVAIGPEVAFVERDPIADSHGSFVGGPFPAGLDASPGR